ncbi:hypothetical protein NIES4103_15240 [Nostoc sp. NIES-4103]|nr:hypothetical protein NIES4103_15240 [Nostoc sp. NIES-4103]
MENWKAPREIPKVNSQKSSGDIRQPGNSCHRQWENHSPFPIPNYQFPIFIPKHSLNRLANPADAQFLQRDGLNYP